MIAWDVNATLERTAFYCSEDLAWSGFINAFGVMDEALAKLDLSSDELMDWATRNTVDYFRTEFNVVQGLVTLN